MSGRTKRRRGEAQAAPRPQMPPKMHARIPGGSWDVFQTLRGFIATWLELARAECGSKPRFWKILFKRSPTTGHRGGEKHMNTYAFGQWKDGNPTQFRGEDTWIKAQEVGEYADETPKYLLKRHIKLQHKLKWFSFFARRSSGDGCHHTRTPLAPPVRVTTDRPPCLYGEI